ncbi:hypothetical protein BTE48_01370 [Oceanospirillum multiglobuliferum]|uniref:Oxidoreductase molybdopterin-binding domain-containing protein n=2 Tax=Oceanospirillum multiglobuliferum TaxID=64969 RepID=A0A1V4TBA7_9GAMM|nr:hypothetical protein BTE48_01370 [Oceanospirillum multiglobuliferum]
MIKPIHSITAALVSLLLLTFLIATPLQADQNILTVTGEVTGSNHHFSLADLKAMPNYQVKTETIWTDQEHTYTAISVAQLLEKLGAKGQNLRFIALNDYAIEVPVDILLEHNAFIAFEQDGKPMRIRDKGPLWVLYPFSDQPQINTPFYQAHCAWQLKTIEVF